MTAFKTILSLYSKHSKPLFSANSKHLLCISALPSDKPGMRKSPPEVWASEGLLSLTDVLGCTTVLRTTLSPPSILKTTDWITSMQFVQWVQTEVPFLLFTEVQCYCSHFRTRWHANIRHSSRRLILLDSKRTNSQFKKRKKELNVWLSVWNQLKQQLMKRSFMLTFHDGKTRRQWQED